MPRFQKPIGEWIYGISLTRTILYLYCLAPRTQHEHYITNDWEHLDSDSQITQTTDFVSSSYFQIGQHKVLFHRQIKFNITKEKILQMGHWTALRYQKSKIAILWITGSPKQAQRNFLIIVIQRILKTSLLASGTDYSIWSSQLFICEECSPHFAKDTLRLLVKIEDICQNI